MTHEMTMRHVVWFIETVKKWNIPSRLPSYIAYLKSIENADLLSEQDTMQLIADGIENNDMKSLYKVFWAMTISWCCENTYDVDYYNHLLDNLFSELVKRNELNLQDKKYFDGFHGIWALIEHHAEHAMSPQRAGYLPLSTRHMVEKVQKDLIFEPLKAYHFDRHTWYGAQQARKHKQKMIDNIPVPTIDLRWSGIELGSVWRELCPQSVDLLTANWEDVDTSQMWKYAVKVDMLGRQNLWRTNF